MSLRVYCTHNVLCAPRTVRPRVQGARAEVYARVSATGNDAPRGVHLLGVLPIPRSDPQPLCISCVKREDVQLKHRQDLAAARGEHEESVGELRVQVSQAVERAKKFEAMACASDDCSCQQCAVLYWGSIVPNVLALHGVGEWAASGYRESKRAHRWARAPAAHRRLWERADRRPPAHRPARDERAAAALGRRGVLRFRALLIRFVFVVHWRCAFVQASGNVHGCRRRSGRKSHAWRRSWNRFALSSRAPASRLPRRSHSCDSSCANATSSSRRWRLSSVARRRASGYPLMKCSTYS